MMGHFPKNAHRRIALSTPSPVLPGVGNNCTLPRQGTVPLQVDHSLNQTNGLLQGRAPSQRLPVVLSGCSAANQLSRHCSLGALRQCFLLVVLFTTTTSTLKILPSDALSVINKEAHSHLHRSHRSRTVFAHRLIADHQSSAISPLLTMPSLPFNASHTFAISPTIITTTAITSVHVPTNSLSLPELNDSINPSSFNSLPPLSPQSTTSALLIISSSRDSRAHHSKSARSIAPLAPAPCTNNSTHSRTTGSGDQRCSRPSVKADRLIDMKQSTGGAPSGVNSSDNGTSSASDLYNSSWNVHLIWYSVFGVMIVVGLVANLLVVATISSNKSLHTITNCFLLNLTVSDLLTLIFNANFNLYFLLTGHWPFGRVFCVVNNFITNLTIFSSVCTIMFTSKERYNAIVHPLRKRMTKQRAFVHIFIIWFGATLFAVPTLIFSRTLVVRMPHETLKDRTTERAICILKWPDGYPWQSRLDFFYNLLFLILTYILPLMTMGIAYTLMARVLWGSKQIGESTQAQMNLICSKQKVVRMLICVTVLFGCCWLPYHVYFLCTYQWPWLVNSKATQHIYLAIYWLAMSNSMLNPIILLLMNRRFRRYSTKFLNCWPFTQIFPCISAAQQSLPSEACNTAIVTHGPNHQETQTVLLCNGLQDGSGAGVAGEGEEEDMPEAEGKTMYDNGGDSSNGEQKHLNHSNSHNNSHNHQHYQNHHHHHHHHHRNGYSLRKDSSQKSTRPLVASMSIRYSP